MIWLAWRQHRSSLLAGAATFVVLAAFIVWSGNDMHRAYTELGLDQCAVPTTDSCSSASIQFQQRHAGYQFLIPLFLLLPALAGVFWGAPLIAREIEHGTHRLVWTQSITRRRWMAVKVALLATVVAVGFAALTSLLQWWAEPILSVVPARFDPGIFDFLGLMPTAYAIAALAIGIAAGSFTRKLVPAIGLTLVLFLVLRVGVEFGLRPHYMAPITTTIAFPADNPKVQLPDLPAGWILEANTWDATGRHISDGVGLEFNGVRDACPETAGLSPDDLPDVEVIGECARRAGFHVVATYHPADRYWRFQVTEAAIFLVLSGALVVGSGWWVRRRAS